MNAWCITKNSKIKQIQIKKRKQKHLKNDKQQHQQNTNKHSEIKMTIILVLVIFDLNLRPEQIIKRVVRVKHTCPVLVGFHTSYT